MTRTRLRGYLERISDVEFQCVEPSMIDAVSKLELSQILIDLSHVLGLRSSKKEAADNIERYVLNAHFEHSGKRLIYEGIVKRIRERGESQESSSKGLEDQRRFSNYLVKLIFDLRLFLDGNDAPKSAERLLGFLEKEFQEEISANDFDEFDYLNCLKLQQKLLRAFDSDCAFSDRINLLDEFLGKEIQGLPAIERDPVY